MTTEQEFEQDTLVELPQRLETSAFWSPVLANLSQSALAVNAVNVGGEQEAMASNVGTLQINVG